MCLLGLLLGRLRFCQALLWHHLMVLLLISFQNALWCFWCWFLRRVVYWCYFLLIVWAYCLCFFVDFFAYGLGALYFQAKMSLLPSLVAPQHLKLANEIHSVIFAFCYTAGMALAGIFGRMKSAQLHLSLKAFIAASFIKFSNAIL